MTQLIYAFRSCFQVTKDVSFYHKNIEMKLDLQYDTISVEDMPDLGKKIGQFAVTIELMMEDK